MPRCWLLDSDLRPEASGVAAGARAVRPVRSRSGLPPILTLALPMRVLARPHSQANGERSAPPTSEWSVDDARDDPSGARGEAQALLW